jgi:methyl-accepting chemotaxis protein
LKEKLDQILERALGEINSSDKLEKLNDIKTAFLGKKGELTAVLKGMKDVAPEDRPKVGQMVNETREKIADSLTNAIEAAIEKAKAAIDKVKSWGKELVDGIASGMNDAQSNLQQAANKTAGTISAYLHFSQPDAGPLANIDRWMPDMMNLLASGIMANMGQIEQAANLTANNIYMPISGNEEIAAGLNRMNNTLSERETPVNVNVTLQGGAEKFFKEVVSVNQRRTMSTGYNQLAMR